MIRPSLFCRYYIQAAGTLMIQQRAALALSFSMVSLKSLQTFTSASGSTVAGIQGLDTDALCSKKEHGFGTGTHRRVQMKADGRGLWRQTVLSYSSITTPFHSHMHFCLWAGVYPQMSAVALQSLSVPRHMRSRNNLTRKCMRKALFTDSGAWHFLC